MKNPMWGDAGRQNQTYEGMAHSKQSTMGLGARLSVGNTAKQHPGAVPSFQSSGMSHRGSWAGFKGGANTVIQMNGAGYDNMSNHNAVMRKRLGKLNGMPRAPAAYSPGRTLMSTFTDTRYDRYS